MPLTDLPYEVLSIITEELDLEDVFHLGLTCPQLLHLIQDNRSCRGVLEVSPSFFSLLPSFLPSYTKVSSFFTKIIVSPPPWR